MKNLFVAAAMLASIVLAMGTTFAKPVIVAHVGPIKAVVGGHGHHHHYRRHRHMVVVHHH